MQQAPSPGTGRKPAGVESPTDLVSRCTNRPGRYRAVRAMPRGIESSRKGAHQSRRGIETRTSSSVSSRLISSSRSCRSLCSVLASWLCSFRPEYRSLANWVASISWCKTAILALLAASGFMVNVLSSSSAKSPPRFTAPPATGRKPGFWQRRFPRRDGTHGRNPGTRLIALVGRRNKRGASSGTLRMRCPWKFARTQRQPSIARCLRHRGYFRLRSLR
jgi:hypothetical protein